MTKRNLVIVAAIVIGALAIQFFVGRQTKLQDANQSLQHKLIELRAENSRLSNQVFRTSAALVQNSMLSAELLRLRQQVEALRLQTNDLARLREALEQMETSDLASNDNGMDDLPDLTEPVALPKDMWQFVGYSTPDAALESTLWALDHGEAATFLKGCTPALQQQLAREWAGQSDTELAATARDQVGRITGYRVVDRVAVSDSEVILTVYGSGSGDLSAMRLQLIDGEWRYAGLARN